MSKDNLSRLTHIKLSSKPNRTQQHISEPKQVDTKKVESDTVEQSTEAVEKKSATVKEPVSMQTSEPKPKLVMPKFLERLSSAGNQIAEAAQNVPLDRALVVIGEKTGAKNNQQSTNPNSFSSIFNRDHQEITGIQRVFKKSITFMLLHLGSFGLLALSGVNLFTFSPILIIASVLAYLSITNIFYIIVADRSYVWLSLAAQFIILILVQSFLGLGFHPFTLLCGFIFGLIGLSAYSELEKIQLGSRLFSVSYITNATTRLLGTLAVGVLSLGFLNSVVSVGAADFTQNVLLQNDAVVDYVLVGRGTAGRLFNLNTILLPGAKGYGVGNTTNTYLDFLADTYDGAGGRNILTEKAEGEVRNTCALTNNVDGESAVCDQAVEAQIAQVLDEWESEKYPAINYGLDEVLDGPKYREVVRAHYTKLAADFANSDIADAAYILPIEFLLPQEYILPAIFTLFVFAALFVIKVLASWVVKIVTWILWSLLKMLGFVKIEIETVEAEIVSI